MPAHPVRLHTGEDRARNRLTVAFRLILAIPHLVWLALWSIGALLAAIAGWFATLATGRLPDGLHGLLAWAVRYEAQYWAYLMFLTDRYPYTGPDGRGRPEPEPAPVPDAWQVAPERP